MDAQLSDASKSRVGKVGIILTNYRPHPPTWLRAVQCSACVSLCSDLEKQLLVVGGIINTIIVTTSIRRDWLSG